MIPREIIQKILEAGVQAPSGGNSQPWKFKLTGETLQIFMIPDRDHAILNFHSRGTLLAHGALIENISIAARHYGFEAEIKLFPDNADPNLVAEVRFGEREKKDNVPDLWNAIWKRATNRKPYETRKVDEEIKEALRTVPAEIGAYDVILKLTDDREQINALAKAASANEIVMFEDKNLHRLFFKELVWTDLEEKEKRSGLYLRTMELAPPQAIALRLFKFWPIMRLFDFFGAARGIAAGNAKGYAACALYGAVLYNDEDKGFIHVGRVIERTWLKATDMGLSFHLQTGINFLWQRVLHEERSIFETTHKDIICAKYKSMTNIFEAGDKLVPAIFRIGYDGEPSGRSSRKAPEVIFNN